MQIFYKMILLVICLIPEWVMADANEIAKNSFSAVFEEQRIIMIGSNIQFSDEEREKFWNMYKEYKNKRNKLNDELFELIVDYSKTYKDLSDEMSIKLTDAYLHNEQQHLDLKKSYIGKFRTILSPKKVAQFFQIENKLWSVVLSAMAEAIPVIE